MMKKVTLFCVLSMTCFALWADGGMPADTIVVEVRYRQGDSRLELAYLDNRDRLDSLVEVLHRLSPDSAFRLERFHITSGASPEGNTQLNKRLSEDRTKNIRTYLDRRIAPSLASKIAESHVGTDWAHLRALVEHSGMPYKEEVLDILRNTPEWVVKNGVVVDSRKRQLMNLRKGVCWHYLEEHFFPEMRHSRIELEYTLMQRPYKPERASGAVEVVRANDSVSSASETEADGFTTAQPVEPELLPPFLMAVKTNLLYDALLVPNLGVEFYLGKGFSVSGEWVYAWWNNNKHHRYWRLYGGELAVRKYFGRLAGGSPLTRHHWGIYGQLFTYDFEVGGRGYMGGRPGGTLWEKMNYGVGVEYGYSLPIARKLNLDFSVGLGYWGGTYYEYEPMDNHYVWLQTKERHWFGPTKAEISLVWLLGRGHRNVKKGGKL